MSYRQILYQTVITTKHREPTIAEAHCTELYQYIWGVVKNKKCNLFRINGVENHIHLLTDLYPTIALADFVKGIKVGSSLWMKASGQFPDFIGWGESYGTFTYSIRERDKIINYIKNQKEHHKKITLEDEYRTMLDEHGISYNEKYLFQ